MNITETNLKDCFVIEPNVFEDQRGYFFESFNQEKFNHAIGKQINFVQDNESQSKYGVVRGLHIQRESFSQAKLVRVISGKILDIVVDVRKNSPTFGKSISVELSGENKKQLFIPRGFLHGFSVLSENVIFSYKCDNYYNKDSEDGVNPFDETLNINWMIPTQDCILSDKDKTAKSFKEYNPF